MDFLVPAALAFSAIIPIILVFYFMRPKRQERVIGSTLLWQQTMQDLQASRPWQRLRITPLLLLQLLAALLIILILIRPAIFTNNPVSGNTIIILQTSASMQATDVAPTRFDNARNTISDYIDNLGPDDYLSLITMARSPQVLVANSQDKALLHSQLQQARVTNQDADLTQALSLATSLAVGKADTQILVIGDGHVLKPDQQIVTSFPVHYIKIGTNAPNAAIMALSSRTVDSQLIAFAQVANYSPTTRAIPVELYTNNTFFGVKTLTLAPGATGTIEWGPLAQSTTLLHARLITQDALKNDHEAWAIAGNTIHGKILLVTTDNIYLQTALRLQPGISLYETTPAKYTPGNNYDLTVFDGYTPPTLPAGNLLFINPPTGNYLFGTVEQETHISHINTGDDPSNLLSNVDLSTIHTLRTTHQLKPAIWAQPVITTPETPLLLAGEDNNRRVAAFGFDLHDSDLALQPSFPILMLNVLNWFLPAPVGGNGQIQAGMPVTIQTWSGTDRVTITNPQQQSSVVGPPFPVSPYADTNAVGLYQVAQRVNGHILNGAFTVNLFDAGQSNLSPAVNLPVTNGSIVAPSHTIPRQLREIWPWIAAFLLLVLCAEWWLFSRNYRSQKSPSSPYERDLLRFANKNHPNRNRYFTRWRDQCEQELHSIKRQIKKIRKNLTKKLRQRTKGERRANI